MLKMKIPFVDLSRPHRKIRKEIDFAIKKVIDTGRFILGKEVEAFEQRFSSYVGTKYCIGVNSGTDALVLAIRSLGIKEKSEVLVPANTFIATSHAVVANRLRPVFVDIDPDDYGFSLSDLKKKISRRTRLIIPVHLFGQPDKMDEIKRATRGKNIKLLEDASQAHGARYKGRKVGTLGEIAAFSFYPGKNLGAMGDAGAILTDSKTLYGRLRSMRQFGEVKKNVFREFGFNSRLDTIQAAILGVKLKYLEGWNKERRKIAQEYTRQLKNIDGIITPETHKGRESVFHLYVIRVKNRDRLIQYLAKKNIYAQIHYPKPLHLQECYRKLGYRRGDLPNAERACSEIVSLPIFPGLKKKEVEHICMHIKEFTKE